MIYCPNCGKRKFAFAFFDNPNIYFCKKCKCVFEIMGFTNILEEEGVLEEEED